MKKANVDLVVGASIFFSLIILITGVLWLKEFSVTRKLTSYAVLFPNVGTLQAGDLVMVNGIPKGSVKKLDIRGNLVSAIIDLDRKIKMTSSCKVTVQNIGLMGERGVGITLDSAGVPIPSISGKDTVYIQGYFDTGIAEAMGMVGTVLTEVQELAINVSEIINQTVGDTSFSTTFNRLINRLDTITDVAQLLLETNQPKIDTIVLNISALTKQLNWVVEQNKDHIYGITSGGDTLISAAQLILNRVDTLAIAIKQIVDEIQAGKGTVGKLIKNEQFYYDLKKSIADLDALVNDVQENALKLRVKFGFGKPKK